MEYLKKLKHYINDNLERIPIPRHQLHKKFNISESKLEKDFRKHEGITLRNYLIRLKVNLALKLKQENPLIKNIDMMADINYNYVEKSFRNHLKQFGKESFDNNNLFDFFLHSKNREVFLEIFVRLILFNEFAEVEIDNNSAIIKHNVKDSIFQFTQFILPIESTHTYFINLDVDTMELNYMIIIQRLINLDEEDKNTAYVPNHISPYFNLLYNIEKKVESYIDYKFTDCIKDWDKYASLQKHVSMSFSEYNYYELDVNVEKRIIELNRLAPFIKGTNYIIDDLKNKLLSEFEKVFNNNFIFNLSNFRNYLKYVKEGNYEKMKSFLNSFNCLDIKNIDLLIHATCHPYLNDLEINEYHFYIEEISILKKLSELNNKELTDLFIKFRITYNSLDEYDEITIEELLFNLLN